MLKHVLIPVDGSELSRKAIGAAIEVARQLGAKLTAYHALEGFRAQGAVALAYSSARIPVIEQVACE